jgi:hypothetical protein
VEVLRKPKEKALSVIAALTAAVQTFGVPPGNNWYVKLKFVTVLFCTVKSIDLNPIVAFAFPPIHLPSYDVGAGAGGGVGTGAGVGAGVGVAGAGDGEDGLASPLQPLAARPPRMTDNTTTKCSNVFIFSSV